MGRSDLRGLVPEFAGVPPLHGGPGTAGDQPRDPRRSRVPPVTVPAAEPTIWAWIALALGGLVALSVAAPRLRRHVLAAARASR
jgi:hypothetical protein